MHVGDRVIWEERVYVVRGFDPMSIADERAEIDDPVSGARIRVRVDELRPAPTATTDDPLT
jgi:hypothetical protein